MVSEFALIKVEVLDPVMRERDGRFKHVGREMALKGVRKGKWKIVEGHEDRELRADAGSGDYLTRSAFQTPPVVERPQTMGFADLYGEKKDGGKDEG